MSKTFAPQAIALSLAALVTGLLLSSVGHVADRQYSEVVAAQAPVQTLDTQYVTITAKRLPRA